MSKSKNISLSRGEIRQLLDMVEWVVNTEVYWGNREAFESRNKSIMRKLEDAYKPSPPEPEN